MFIISSLTSCLQTTTNIHFLFYRNPGVRTIEEDLLEAMSKAKAFPPEMKTNLGQVCDW